MRKKTCADMVKNKPEGETVKMIGMIVLVVRER